MAPLVASTGSLARATVAPFWFVTVTDAWKPAPGDGVSVAEMVIVWLPDAGFGDTWIEIEAAAIVIGESMRNAASIPAARIERGFMAVSLVDGYCD
jgi:hypothetical protein